MEELANLFHGFGVALQPFNMTVMIVGITTIAVASYEDQVSGLGPFQRRSQQY